MIAARLQQVWYGERRPGPFLTALEYLYASMHHRAQRRRYARRPPGLVGTPIVVVGNLVAGGAGKTPLVIALCEALLAAGMRPGVISRGYGRRSRRAMGVLATSDADLVGDEPLLIARSCPVPVRVDANREAAAKILFSGGVDVVVSDDGLQRASLPRALEICVVDGQRGFGNGRMLPAGPLRDPLDRLEQVNWLVRNGPGQQDLPAAVEMTLEPGEFRSLSDGRRMGAGAMRNYLKGRTVHTVAGIAHPQRFHDTVRGLLPGIGLQPHDFRDHYRYAATDFDSLKGVILMTEKDAVKCGRLALGDAWSLPVRARLPGSFLEEFVAAVRSLTRAV